MTWKQIWSAITGHKQAPCEIERVERSFDRRGFLSILGGAVAGTAIASTFDVDRALWLPSSKLISAPAQAAISIPSRSGNTFLTPEMITNDVLRILQDQLQISRLVTGNYDRQFKSGTRISDTIMVRRPFSYVIQ